MHVAYGHVELNCIRNLYMHYLSYTSIVCQSTINYVRVLCNEYFDSHKAVDNVVVVN